ncbi:MAG: alpha/beta fold hydrolase [Deltaproteobacteria bacterium]|nr:alpha/beta fold hydrolase [Deltaproteobacteria bacterium]
MQLLHGAEPFRLDAGPSRVLLLHGFASTPFEMRYLGEKLQQAGYTSVCPLLPGHGTDPAVLARTRWQDWASTAQEALQRLHREAGRQKVAVVGQSLGALLALQLAALFPETVAALACLATLLEVGTLSGAAVTAYRYSLLRLLDLSVPRPGGADIRETRLRRGLPSYDRVPLRAAASLRELQGKVARLLPRVRAPLLVLHGRQDHTAPLDSAEQVVRQAASSAKRLEIFPGSYHVLSLDVEKSEVATAILDFFRVHHQAGEKSPPL